MSGRLTRILNSVFLGVGVAILAVLLSQLDIVAVGENLIRVGWRFIAILAVYVLGMTANSVVWLFIIDPQASRARLRHVLGAHWAGAAINGLTPGSNLGDVLKGTLLKGRVDGDETVASLVTLNLLSSATGQVFVVAGLLICLAFVQFPTWLILSLLGAALMLFLPLILIYLLLRRGLVSRLARFLGRLPLVKIKNPEKLLTRARSVDQRIRSFRKQRPDRFRLAVLWYFGVRLLQVAEVWILLTALLPGIAPYRLLLLALLTQTTSQLVGWAMTLVPGQLGVAEGASTLLFKLAGFDPVVGLSMELARRIRRLVGIAIGLVIGVVMGWKPVRKSQLSKGGPNGQAM
jgi:uncharacterized protein (TIRG00374 family)